MTQKKFVIENLPPPPDIGRRGRPNMWSTLPLDKMKVGQSVLLEELPLRNSPAKYLGIYATARRYLMAQGVWDNFLIYKVASKNKENIIEARLARVK